MSAIEIVVIIACSLTGYWIVSLMMRSKPKSKPRQQSGPTTADGHGNNHRSSHQPEDEPEPPPKPDRPESASSHAKNWFTVLNVSPSASADEIRRAYKVQMSQYHPDKVAALGAELRELAERKTKDITDAYRQAMAKHSL